MKISKIPGLGRFGIFIDDVDLSTISDDEWMRIGQLHMENLVTIIRNSNCTKDRQSELTLKFGDTRYGLKVFLLNKYNVSWGELINRAINQPNLLDATDTKAIVSLLSTQEKTSNGKDVSRVTGGGGGGGSCMCTAAKVGVPCTIIEILMNVHVHCQ